MTIVTLIPIVVSAVRGIHGGWLPAGDNGLIAIRARDVFSGSPPLLFTWSSASTFADDYFNHPGPLLFDLFSLPAVLFGRAGLAVGAAVLNVASVLGIAILSRRQGGAVVGAVAVTVTAALCWSMGSELLYDPWSPNSLMLPFLLFLVLTWCVSAGRWALLPLLVAVGSLLLEMNLGYALVVPSLWAWSLLTVGLDLRRRRRSMPASWAASRRRALRIGAASLGVLLACWIQPIIEQFTSEGDGNITRMVAGVGDLETTLGLREGTRLFAAVAALPPLWLRPSLRTAYSDEPSIALAVTSLLIFAVVLGACAWDARRRSDRHSAAAVGTAAVILVVGLATVARTPLNWLGAIVRYQTRLLWPLAAFLTLAVVVTVARRLEGSRVVRSTVLVAVLAATTGAAAVLTLPRVNHGTDAPGYTLPVVRDVIRQLSDAELDGTLFYDWKNSGTQSETFVNHYGSAVLAELQRRDVPFVVENEMLLRSVGEERRFTGRNADAVLTVRTGDGALEAPPGGRTVALHRGLEPREERELEALKRQLIRYVEEGNLELNPRGEAAFERLADLPGAEPAAPAFDPEELLASRGLLALYTRGELVLDDEAARRFGRYADLQRRWDLRTVGVFVAPLAERRP